MVDGFWEETIVANGFLKDFYNSTIVVNYFFKLEPLVSMVFQWFLTIEPLPLNQWFCSRPLGTMDFRWLMRKKRQWFSKIAIYDKKLLLEFKLPTQIEIAQSYQEHHALLPHAMWTYICQNWDLNSSKWGPKFVKMGTHFEWNEDFFQQKWGPKKYIFQGSQWGFDKLFEISREACITHFEELYIIN